MRRLLHREPVNPSAHTAERNGAEAELAAPVQGTHVASSECGVVLICRSDRVQDVLGREVVCLRDDGVARRAARAVLLAAGSGQLRPGGVVDRSADTTALHQKQPKFSPKQTKFSPKQTKFSPKQTKKDGFPTDRTELTVRGIDLQNSSVLMKNSSF